VFIHGNDGRSPAKTARRKRGAGRLKNLAVGLDGKARSALGTDRRRNSNVQTIENEEFFVHFIPERFTSHLSDFTAEWGAFGSFRDDKKSRVRELWVIA
jgi:hypothetical protein